MTFTGWEFWGLKFSWMITALLAIVVTPFIWLAAKDPERKYHLDTMAGDEGEEW